MITRVADGTAWRKMGRLETPQDHVTLLHPFRDGVQGLVTVAQRVQGHWQETRWPVAELPRAVRDLAGVPDVYLSQNRFKGPRRIAHLWQLDALWVDLDFHKVPQWADKPSESIWELAKDVLEEQGIPRPTLAVATGRGLALVWVHHPIPRPALPRWNACQQRLFHVFKPLGADRGALDAARVLRIVGTQNAKSGQLVRALTPTGDVWEFDALADELLPLTRGELSDLRIQRALRRAETPRQDKKRPGQGFSIATLWEARLSDLQRLLELRWFGTLPPGQRDSWLFLAVNAMAWLAPPDVLYREAWALAKQVGGWDAHEASARLQAIFKRAQAAAQGQTVEWHGKAVDPRYMFRTATMLEWLDITPDEQQGMRTLIGPEEKRRRHQEAERERKRVTGETQQDRNQYLQRAAERRREAQARHAQGESLRQIAEALGVTEGAVRYMLKKGGA